VLCLRIIIHVACEDTHSHGNSLHYYYSYYNTTDHDYGCNNADRTYEFKHESAIAYVDFLGEHYTSAMSRRARAGHGVYGVKLFDFSKPQGQMEVDERDAAIDPDAIVGDFRVTPFSYSNQTVAVFVLDVRSHKTPWKTGSDAYAPDYDGDFLGERQWKWLETAIRRSRASVNVVVNGLQVHANKFPNGNIAEAWGKYPRAQERLFDALLQDGVQSPVLISGDIHMTQMMRKDCVKKGDYGSAPRPLVELTTSGMTHSWGSTSTPTDSDPAYKPSWKTRYESSVAAAMMQVLHHACPWTDIMKSEPPNSELSENTIVNGGGEGARQGLQFNLQKNFGELEFDWDERTVSIRAFGETPDAAPLLMAKIGMDQLSGHTPTPNDHLTSADFRDEVEYRRHYPESEWICINHRGRENHLGHMFGHIATGAVLTFLVPVPFFLPCLLVFLLLRKVYTRRKSYTATLKVMRV
jgi:hypothetical protein